MVPLSEKMVFGYVGTDHLIPVGEGVLFFFVIKFFSTTSLNTIFLVWLPNREIWWNLEVGYKYGFLNVLSSIDSLF